MPYASDLDKYADTIITGISTAVDKAIIKTRINQLQKQVKDKLGVKTQASWEKFCNSISLETDPRESWHKIKNISIRITLMKSTNS